MSEFISWAQSNWNEVGTLLIQLAFLISAVWFARNILKTARVFQEQIGALVRLSITAPPAELHAADASAKRSMAEASLFLLTPPETQTISLAEPADIGPNAFAAAWRSVVRWLQAPMSTSQVGPWRRVIH